MRRYVEEDRLLREVPEEQREAVRRWLAKQPTAPRLVGATRAAALLGVQPPHLARLRKQGRMPEPIPVEGSVDVYVYEEVLKLARELGAEREVRAERRRLREGVA